MRLELGESVISSGAIRINKKHQFKILAKFHDYAYEYVGGSSDAGQVIAKARDLGSALRALGFAAEDEDGFLMIRASHTHTIMPCLNLNQWHGKFFPILAQYIDGDSIITFDYYEYGIKSAVRRTIRFEKRTCRVQEALFIESDSIGNESLRPIHPSDDRNYGFN